MYCFVCKCVPYYCHRVSTQLQLTNISYLRMYEVIMGHAVEQLVEALRYKPEGSEFDSRWDDSNFSLL